MSPAKTMMNLGILPEHFDPRLAKPGPASASSTFDLLKIAPEETGESEERCAGLRLNLSWETPDFDTFKSCMLGLIGKFLTLHLVGDERLEVQVVDLRTVYGVDSIVCWERGGKKGAGYAQSLLSPSRLTIPFSKVTRVHVGAITPR
jgi:hypothetical protein